MKKMMIATLVTLTATVSHAQDQELKNFCAHQALQIQQSLSRLNELALNEQITKGEYSVLLEMQKNSYKAFVLICPQK